MSVKHRPRNAVRLTGYARDGQRVFGDDLPVDAFYEKSHPALDDPGFRSARGIVRLSAVVFSAQGAVAQEFELRFDASGRCVADAARFADGSVVGDFGSAGDDRQQR